MDKQNVYDFLMGLELYEILEIFRKVLVNLFNQERLGWGLYSGPMHELDDEKFIALSILKLLKD